MKKLLYLALALVLAVALCACGEGETTGAEAETTAPSVHTHNYETVITPPTCTEQGYTTYHCDCGDTYVADYVEATGHRYGDWYVVTEATCTENGLKRHDCTNCDHYETEEIGATDHTYTTVVKAPTCTEQGYTTHICSCGHSCVDDYVPATDHAWSVEYRWSEDGKECTATHVCGNDASHNVTVTATVTSEQTKAPTCLEVGETTYTATFDVDWAETQTKTLADVPANGHQHVTATAAIKESCTEDGNSAYWYCADCEKYFGDEACTTEIEENSWFIAAHHNYKNRVCEDCGKKQPSEGLEFELNDDGESYYVSGIGTCEDKNVVIPEIYNGLPVTGIGSSAFFECDSLTSIVIPDSVTSIGYEAFYCCRNLTSIEIPDSMTNIGSEAFYYCCNLTSIEIPNGVTRIGYCAFSGCRNLTSIVIPDSVTYIGFGAFEECENLRSVTIGSGVYNIEEGLFAGSDNLLTVTVSEENSIYHSSGNCIIETATKTLVAGCKNSVIPDDGSVTKIGYCAFTGCYFTSITIPNTITYIDEYAFNYCLNLISVTIPDSVIYIGEGAFEECENLKSIFLGTGVMVVENQAFEHCSNLNSITVAEGNPVYHSSGNCLIETASKTLYLGCGTSVIPDDGSVTTIGDYAFYDCANLTGIVIPEGVKSIGQGAFASCENLKTVTISDSVTSVGSYAFSGCSSLTNVVIPNSVTSIGNAAFADCGELETITFDGTIEQWHDISKEYGWNYGIDDYTIICSNGEYNKYYLVATPLVVKLSRDNNFYQVIDVITTYSSIYYWNENTSIVSCKWGDFSNGKTQLYISGENYGATTVYIYDSDDGSTDNTTDVIRITVTVEE